MWLYLGNNIANNALAHIELNTIDLAWDLMARNFNLGCFQLPKAFYDDWVKVADDEAKHHLDAANHL